MGAADELLLLGVQLSSGGVRGVWSRHGPTTEHERLLRLEETAGDRKPQLTDCTVSFHGEGVVRGWGPDRGACPSTGPACPKAQQQPARGGRGRPLRVSRLVQWVIVG